MSLQKGLATLIVVFVSSFAGAAEVDEVQVAQDQVDNYRALRHACSITQGEQRRVCFSQLNDATEDYKRAKKVLAMAKLASKQQLIGQAQ